PGLDGIELVHALRADPRTGTVPVILLSARSGEEARVEGLEAGADDYLTKPFGSRELLARVRTHLELARVRREAARREQELLAETRAAKERLETVLGSIRDAFAALDRDGRFTYVNDKAAEVAGLPKEELLGRGVWEVFPDLVGSEAFSGVSRAA